MKLFKNIAGLLNKTKTDTDKVKQKLDINKYVENKATTKTDDNIITKLRLCINNIDITNIENKEVIQIIDFLNVCVDKQKIDDTQIKNIYNKILDISKEDDINIEKIEELKNKITSIKKIIKLIDNLDSNIKQEDLTYENILNSDLYMKINKIKELLIEIKKIDLNILLENNLGSIYLDFEKSIKPLLNKIDKLVNDCTNLINNIDILKDDVKTFTIMLNKSKSKTKIELKQEYDKLQRTRETLFNKKEEYTKLELDLNNQILDIIEEIKINIVMFNELIEYINLYLLEHLNELNKNLNTYTKDKNINSINKIKYTREILQKLKNILIIGEEGN